MLQVTPQMRVLVAVEPVDGRKGIDSLAQLCREKLLDDPLSGCLFIFRHRSGTTISGLCYDGQGFWLAKKRLSQGHFRHWPVGGAAQALEPYQAHILLAAGDPKASGAPVWRPVRPASAPAKGNQSGAACELMEARVAK
jgi:transposase